MLTEKETTRISKFLSLVLRHQPQRIGITLSESGWTPVDMLLQKLGENGLSINLDDLKMIVATNSKKRFSFSEDGTMIRASQGHSLNVDLGLIPLSPPEVLYHGTAEKNVASILAQGLHKRERHHVHLSAEKEPALSVGGRHGKPVVLTIQSGKMQRDGYLFYRSENGVWLTESVPSRYMRSPLDK